MRRILDIFGRRPSLVLRSAHVSDAADLAEIHAGAFRRGWDTEEFERLLRDTAVRAHVAVEGVGAAPLGFVISHAVAPEAEILSIAVQADRRGQGLGRVLLQHHLSRLASEAITTSFLEVEEMNAPALGLYQRLGYAVVGRRRGYYEGGTADALVLRRDF